MRKYLLLAIGVGLTLLSHLPAAAQQSKGTLGTLSVGSYHSDANGTITGTYSASAMPVTQNYRNTGAGLVDSLAFTAQVLGNGYAQSLNAFYGRLRGLGAGGGEDTYALGDIVLPGPGSYLVQTAAFTYDRKKKEWLSGPTRTYWLFPLPAKPNQPTPLPVNLVRFAATAGGDSVTLNWQTASEQNNLGFWVERSIDGRSFKSTTLVPGHGTTWLEHRYQVREATPALPRIWYRLRQVDLDGSERYSPVVCLMLPQAALGVYPSPAHEQATVSAGAGQLASLYDSTGRLSRQQLLDERGELDLRGLPSGTYNLVVGSQRARLVNY
jgi:hypothetical protein